MILLISPNCNVLGGVRWIPTNLSATYTPNNLAPPAASAWCFTVAMLRQQYLQSYYLCTVSPLYISPAITGIAPVTYDVATPTLYCSFL